MQFYNTQTAFNLAKTARGLGHEVTIFCDGDGVYNLMKCRAIPAERDLTEKVHELVKSGVRLLLCIESARIRGINVENDLVEGSIVSRLSELSKLIVECDKTVAFGV